MSAPSNTETFGGMRVEDVVYNFNDETEPALKQWNYTKGRMLGQLTAQDKIYCDRSSDWEGVSDTISLEHLASVDSAYNRLNRFASSISDRLNASTVNLRPRVVIRLDILLRLFCLVVTQVNQLDPQNRNITMKKVVSLFSKLRGHIDLFNSCLANSTETSAVEMIECAILVLNILVTVAVHIRKNTGSTKISHSWDEVDETVQSSLQEIMDKLNHLQNINRFSREVALSALQRNSGIRPEPEKLENCDFPLIDDPFGDNPIFVGRQDEFNQMNQHLHHTGEGYGKLRTFTLHGRRGVGKTMIAREYVKKNSPKFDAIFWARCEQVNDFKRSFTRMAIQLGLEGAIESGHDDENALLVMRWLERTPRKWLIVFDNGEDENILKGYWPTCPGAIIITSRRIFNFNNDAARKGVSVGMFEGKEAFDVLMQLAGWNDRLKNNELSPEALEAAKELLDKVSGLALALEQLAKLLNRYLEEGGPNHALLKLRQKFEETYNGVQDEPPIGFRQGSDSNKALDVVWTISFSYLSRNARALLDVIAFLPPSNAPIALFCPPFSRQDALGARLSFCRTKAESRIQVPSDELNQAIDDLKKAGLVSQDKRTLRVHRVVIEGTQNLMQNPEEPFNTAVRLVHVAFPNQQFGETLAPRAEQCERYVTHADLLARTYETLQEKLKQLAGGSRKEEGSRSIKTESTFTSLLGNTAWYLYEAGEPEQCIRLTEIARSVCPKDSLINGHLLYTASAAYFDLNDLVKTRDCLIESHKLKENHLKIEVDDRTSAAMANTGKAWIAGSFHTEGNLLSGEDRWDEAMETFQKSEDIRSEISDERYEEQNTPLYAITAIGRARTMLAKAQVLEMPELYDEAEKYLDQAEELLNKCNFNVTDFKAHMHYTDGKLSRARGNRDGARASWEQCIKLLKNTAPISLLISSAYYQLGCLFLDVEPQLTPDFHQALKYLEEAISLWKLKIRGETVDGHLARMLWMKSIALEYGMGGTRVESPDSRQARTEAELMRKNVEAKVAPSENRGGHPTINAPALDANADATNSNVVTFETERVWNYLVAPFYR